MVQEEHDANGGAEGLGWQEYGSNWHGICRMWAACIAAQWHATEWGGMNGVVMGEALITTAAQCHAMPSNVIPSSCVPPKAMVHHTQCYQ